MVRVLVLEDDELAGELMTRVLQRNNFEVEVATTIKSAGKMLAENSYDVAILDNRLSDGLGVNFLPTVIKTVPHAIMHTSDGYSDIFIRQAKANGARCVFAKPVDLKLLAGYILTLISDHSESQFIP